MTPPTPPLPSDAEVVAALAPLVAPVSHRGAVTLASRRPNDCSSSSPTEIVTLDVADTGRREVFLKYDRGVQDPEPRCRHGAEYCGLVYERLVRRVPLPHVTCLGLIRIGSSPVAALAFEYLAGALRVNEAPDESGVLAAAEWCGRLHAWGARRPEDPALGFLDRHDVDYYRAWATRARKLAAAVGPLPASIGRICADFGSLAVVLAAAEPTTIHGEFGPQNVLWRDGVVYPVDWESAAVGAGAIDLATLLFGWPADVVRRGIDAYWLARGAPAPAGFASLFAAATVYTALRWLPVPTGGDDPRWHEAIGRLEAAATLQVRSS